MNARPVPDTDIESGLIVVLQPMKRRHLRQIMKIERQVYPNPWSPSVFTNELAAPKLQRRYIVAKVNNRVIGYAGMMFMEDARDGSPSAHITNIAVDPGWHRHKIGSRLLFALARIARENGVVGLTLEVRHTNVAAQRLYHRFGFLQEGVRKRYYENTDDALVLWASGIHQPAYSERLSDLLAEIGGQTVTEGLFNEPR
jgi:[ribosomal protein S18]-alanine N-acetyltransferase